MCDVVCHQYIPLNHSVYKYVCNPTVLYKYDKLLYIRFFYPYYYSLFHIVLFPIKLAEKLTEKKPKQGGDGLNTVHLIISSVFNGREYRQKIDLLQIVCLDVDLKYSIGKGTT